MIIHGFHQHIDNGGISVEIHRDKDGFLSLVTDASYFGYPSIKSELQFSSSGQYDPKEFLKEVGTMLIEAAAKLE